MASSPREWESLHELVLDRILHKIRSLPDLVRFASVCSSWRSVSKTLTITKNNPSQLHLLPMLLFPPREDRAEKTRTLYSVEDAKTYRVPLSYYAKPTRFLGSSHGWLVSVRPDDLTITLSSPTQKTNTTITLPPIMPTRPHKIILSSNPSDGPYVAVAIIHGPYQGLAILKSGDQSWTFVRRGLLTFHDVAWHEHDLYAVDASGNLVRVNNVLSDNPTPEIVSLRFPISTALRDRYYLVESSRAELYLVERLSNDYFKVYKLEPVKPGSNKETLFSWRMEQVKEVGGDALFVGKSYCMAVAASEVRGFCRKNCLYYTLHTCTFLHDAPLHFMITFCLESGNVEERQRIGYRFLPDPVWFTPDLSSDWV